MATVGFSLADYIVFAAMLSLSVAIGIYYGCTGKKQSTTSEYLLADRRMNYVPVSFSIMASFVSAIGLLGAPAEVYTYGWIYWMGIWCFAIAIPISAHLYLPVFYKLQVTSIYEYLEVRFNSATRLLGTCLYIFYKTTYLSVAVYAPALALSVVSGLNVWLTSSTVAVVCVFYTTLGGMKAVVWTDVLQSLIMFAGILAVIIQGCIDLGGGSIAWQIAEEGGRIYFTDWSLDPTVRHTMWSIFIGLTLGYLPIYGISQATAQRFCSCPSVRDGQKALYLSLPIVMSINSLLCFCGVVMYATYAKCDPLGAGFVEVADQRMAYFIADKFARLPGFSGLFLSAICSAALSTLSSGLHSLSAVTLEDLIKKSTCASAMTDKKATMISKGLCIMYGLVALALVLVVSQMGLILQLALSLGNLILAPVFAMFTLGIFFPWTNSIGVIVGALAGIAVAMVILIGKFIYPPSWPMLSLSTEECFLASTASNYTNLLTSPEMTTMSLGTTTEGELSSAA
ncbi:sodium-coupled monocarboxylate transporter 1-like [Ptychodera flava]|uniref:sodium-coupled monocarboxylate transporter 1-like n=1 Tax=Ptychodera flava TaxID=63121 RepID=UPI00396A159D